MPSWYNIWTVARVETKTLLRSWFFRIFAALGVGCLVLFDIGTLTTVGFAPWGFRGIPSSIPYSNLLLLNTVQAVIAVFLASDFLKRDKKHDTTEVVYMRSMTNWDYVVGKTLGIVFVFMALNVAVLIVAAVFNIFFADVPVMFEAYLLYPLLISIPTILFILGLSFLFMVLIRNQAVTFIVLLGYIAVTLFFIGDRYHRIFDYMAWRVPLFYSGIAGFGDLGSILIQRGIYLLLGLGFILLTILLIKRLPQSAIMTNVSRVLAAAAFAGAVVLCVIYVHRVTGGRNLRAGILELNDRSAGKPVATMQSCAIDLRHEGTRISAAAKIVLSNETDAALEQYIFSLNPGLVVSGVDRGGAPASYSRDLHLLLIEPADALEPGGVDSFTVHYAGRIEQQACYPDVSEEVRERAFRIIFFNVAKRYAFIEPDLLLLTPESLWYPVVGVGAGRNHPLHTAAGFADFDLRVRTAPGLVAVSQGRSTRGDDWQWRFAPETKLTGMSIVAGNFDERSVTVDSVSYNLYTMPGHDYFMPSFTEIGDTLAPLISEFKDDFEGRLELEYQFRRLQLVEVPVQFYFYPRLGTLSHEPVQPEIVLLPEKGITLRGADIRRFERIQRRSSERSNEASTEKEQQCELLRQFIVTTLTERTPRRPFRRAGEEFEPGSCYNLFPTYYTHVYRIGAERWPLLNFALESYLHERIEGASPSFFRTFSGLTDAERTNIELKERSLEEIMQDEEKRDILPGVLKAKGNYLMMLLRNMAGEENFDIYLNGLLDAAGFRHISESSFFQVTENTLHIKLEPLLQELYSSGDLPGFVIHGIENFKLMDKERERYQVKFDVSNEGTAEGLFKVSLQSRGSMGRGGRRGPFMFMMGGRGDDTETEDRIYSIGPGETKELGVLLDFQPRRMSVNTLISQNLPAVIERTFEEFEMEKRAVKFDGERILDHRPRGVDEDGIIVDNEDDGFEITRKPSPSILKRLTGRDKEREYEYEGVVGWGNWTGWRLTTDSRFYGRFVLSAYYAKGRDGSDNVAWKTEISESGYYDIYCHVTKLGFSFRRRREEQPNFGSNHYRVYHDDGVEDAVIDINNAEEGWNFLGSYYISEGEARVELTNESEGRFVVADAVKWVKR